MTRWRRIVDNARTMVISPALVLGFATLAGSILWAGPRPASAADDGAFREGMARVGPGSYRPLFKDEEGPRLIEVAPFLLDRYPVTNREFAEFVDRNPRWSPQNIKPVFADAGYLHQWEEQDLTEIADQPVTNVSWFAARAYCKEQGKRLPTFDEWELTGQASEDRPDGTADPAYRQQILEWYAKPAIMKLPAVQDTTANYWGVHGMHGVVWELVEDFNTALVTGESRTDSQLDNKLYCGAGAAAAVDPGDYAAFMRYAMRSSYEATYTLKSMGFRCAADAEHLAMEISQ